MFRPRDKNCLSLVPSKGLEPPHPCEYMDLNHARLPIPPRWQSELQCSGGRKAAVRKINLAYFTGMSPPVKRRFNWLAQFGSFSGCHPVSNDAAPCQAFCGDTSA